MATLTSVKSGYWSDPTVWDLGVVPANGDSVTIASGHTVIFNVDQSGFTTGLAGLTINGTLKIPSQSEDPNMPNFVCLKVNANIAGTGSFLIGSPTYPITYPQSAKVMVNGSITVATFYVYGERRTPHYDYLAQTSNAGTNTIVLQNGMPLRAGDLIAIGIDGSAASGEPWTYTVQSYDSSTKTVTLTQNLVTTRTGGNIYACLVILLTRQVELQKYGSASTSLITGSGRYIQGAMFTLASGATGYADGTFLVATVQNTTLNNVSSIYNTGTNHTHFAGSNNVLIKDSCSYWCGYFCGSQNDGAIRITVDNCAVVRSHYRFINWHGVKATNVHVMNGSLVSYLSVPASVVVVDNAVVKRGGLVGTSTLSLSSYWDAYIQVRVRNVTLVNGDIYSGDGYWKTFVELENIQGYYNTSMNISFPPTNAFVSMRNVTLNCESGVSLTIAHTMGAVRCKNLTLTRGYIQGFGGEVVFENLTIQNLTDALIKNALGRHIVKNFSVNTYIRPTVRPPLSTDFTENWQRYVELIGATINNVSYPKFYEKIWCYGYIKNRWDASTPDYSTFDFYLTNTTYAAPLYLDFKIYGSSQITVSGTITQLGSGETVKVQIFSADKEPLLGDTPDFEQVYTATGTINVSWTPPSAGEWVVRVQAEMNQTTNPVTIQNLQVGTTGGGGTTPTPVEPAFVFVG